MFERVGICWGMRREQTCHVSSVSFVGKRPLAFAYNMVYNSRYGRKYKIILYTDSYFTIATLSQTTRMSKRHSVDVLRLVH